MHLPTGDFRCFPACESAQESAAELNHSPPPTHPVVHTSHTPVWSPFCCPVSMHSANVSAHLTPAPLCV
jgi:hypothetical protein